MNDIKKKKNYMASHHINSFRGASTNGKLDGTIMLYAKTTILKKINISFIVYFCLIKYSFSIFIFYDYKYFF